MHEDDFDLILLGPMQERQCKTLGNTRICITLPSHQPFRRIRRGVLEATKAAEIPEGWLSRSIYWTKQALIGVPLATARAEHERLTKFKALAVLSSDAISSVALASEAILINLFAVGVFIAFTLSQAGMVVHWWRLRMTQRTWLRSLIINGLGAATTGLVALIVASMKFVDGAWIVVVLVPMMVLMFLGISRHYKHFEQERTFDLPIRPQDIQHRLVVPIGQLDRAAIQSLAYARSISSHVTAVHVVVDQEHVEQLQVKWDRWQKKIAAHEKTHLLIIESPYRSLLRPLLAYIDAIHQRHPQETLTVILPEYVIAHRWEYLLHNQVALRLKAALLFRPGVAVLNLPQNVHN